MEDNDVDLQQKKRARRRLIGAIFFVSVVALVLPMIMDQEPRQQVQDVEIRIPGQDDKPFSPRLAEAPAESATASQGEAKPAEKGLPEPVSEPVKSVTAALPEIKGTAAVPGSSAADAAAAEKPALKTEKAASAEKNPPDAKKDDKPTVRVVEKTEKPKADDAKRAAAILSGASDDAKPAAKGEYLVLIGTFANEGNVKVLKGKLGELGIRTFTEQVTTADGKKIRVRAGPFPSRDAADKALARMKGIGVSGVIAAKS